jgi:hypothetical protein
LTSNDERAESHDRHDHHADDQQDADATTTDTATIDLSTWLTL